MPAQDSLILDRAPAHIAPRLLGLVGEALASGITAALAELGQVDPAAALQRLSALERLGVQLQQVARMVAHEGREPLEDIDLTLACSQALDKGRAQAQGVRVRTTGSPLMVRANAAALEQVLDLLLADGLERASAIDIAVGAVGQPAQATVRIDVTRQPGPPTAPALHGLGTEPSALRPMLAQLLAAGAGLQLRSSSLGMLSTWMVVVPNTDVAEPLPADDALLPRTPVAVGAHILVIDPRAGSRWQAHDLLKGAGMVVDAVESLAQATAALRDHDPDVVVSGLPRHTAGLVELMDEVRGRWPSVRLIELVDEDNAFAFSMPGADAPGRLSRGELAEHLISAVSQEIDAARRV